MRSLEKFLLTFQNVTYSNMENLVLWARSEILGSACK